MERHLNGPRKLLIGLALTILLNASDRSFAIDVPVLSPAQDLTPWILTNGGQVSANCHSKEAGKCQVIPQT